MSKVLFRSGRGAWPVNRGRGFPVIVQFEQNKRGSAGLARCNYNEEPGRLIKLEPIPHRDTGECLEAVITEPGYYRLVCSLRGDEAIFHFEIEANGRARPVTLTSIVWEYADRYYGYNRNETA